jgi:hypothetical protein
MSLPETKKALDAGKPMGSIMTDAKLGVEDGFLPSDSSVSDNDLHDVHDQIIGQETSFRPFYIGSSGDFVRGEEDAPSPPAVATGNPMN